MTPGTSVLVLLTPEAAVGAFTKAFEGQGVELIRSDLSVQEQDEVRAALDDSGAADQPEPPGNVPEGAKVQRAATRSASLTSRDVAHRTKPGRWATPH